MARPLEFDKDMAMEQALQVFWQKGYEKTSLQDLIEAMDLSKSSFYQSFSSKQDLFIKCLENYQNKLVSDLGDNLMKAKTTRKFIEETFKSLISTAESEAGMRGCLLMNSPNEFHFGDVALSPTISVGFEKLQSLLQIAVKQAQKEGDIAPDKDAEALAYFIIANISGLRTMVKVGTNAKTLEKITANILQTIFL